jgi:hypothetical protein
MVVAMEAAVAAMSSVAWAAESLRVESDESMFSVHVAIVIDISLSVKTWIGSGELPLAAWTR